MAKRLTKHNARKVLMTIAARIEANEDGDAAMFCDALNGLLDDLRGEDAFGTEGQCDPRGDQRE